MDKMGEFQSKNRPNIKPFLNGGMHAMHAYMRQHTIIADILRAAHILTYNILHEIFLCINFVVFLYVLTTKSAIFVPFG